MLHQPARLPKLAKEQYKEEMAALQAELALLQLRVKDEGLPVVVVFEGWGTAGKGTVMADLLITLDPRNFTAKSTLPPNCEEVREPFLCRHWRSIPPKGQFAIYDRSWYPEITEDAVEKRISKKKWARRVDAVTQFEKQLADDGYLLVKFFLHIGKEEQKKRLDTLRKNPDTAWRVTKKDYRQNKQYKETRAIFEEVLGATNAPHAPWHIVDATHKRNALVEVYRVLTTRIGAALGAAKANANPTLESGPYTLCRMPALREVPLTEALEKEEYKRQLRELQQRLSALHNRLYLAKRPLVIVYEGWDAAGKGGNIKRLAAALDPRGYEVVPIASPTPPEANRQYLWRFWQQLQKDGHVTIFDRSWYGRVMVERVEGFAAREAWQRAYREINEFENQLHEWGAIVVKFWLHIDKDEQLRRFEARQNTPAKQWKITEEDWRNREKWDAYEGAVDDMLRLTSTVHAPWHIIQSQDKRFGRIQALHAVVEAVETGLRK